MNEIFIMKRPIAPIRTQSPSKIDNMLLRNPNHIKHRLKIDLSPLRMNELQAQDYVKDLEAYRKRDIPLDKGHPSEEIPSGKATHQNSSTTQGFSDADTGAPDSRFASIKTINNNTKQPGFKLKKANQDRSPIRVQDLINNTTYTSKNNDSEKNLKSRRYETPDGRGVNRYRISNSREGSLLNKSARVEKANVVIKEKKDNSSEVREKTRIKPFSIEKREEAIKIFANKEEEVVKDIKHTIEEQYDGRRDSYKTLTSAFNSNQQLLDFCDDFDEEEEQDSEKRLKEVVEKHVEEAYRNIGLIKKNFQRKSKTYLFYIYKDA